MGTIKFELTAATDLGRVRGNNEDNFIVSPDIAANDWMIPAPDTILSLGKLGALLVVADGMGGMNAGEVASSIAVDTVKEFFDSARLAELDIQNEKAVCNYLVSVVRTADSNIIRHANAHPETSGMGTTLVLAWILDKKVFVCWCGDSRCYSFHKKTGLRQLSKDHSYVQDLVDSGKLAPELAFDHPESNIITRSLGNNERPAEPDVCVFPVHDGELFFVCSDGLSGLLRDNEMQAILEGNDNLVECRKTLLNGALEAGGYDNVTLAACQIVSGAGEMSTADSGRKLTNSQFDRLRKKNIILASIVGVLVVGIVALLLLLLPKKPKNNLVLDTHRVELTPSSPGDTIKVNCKGKWQASTEASWLTLSPSDTSLAIVLADGISPENSLRTVVVVSAGKQKDSIAVMYSELETLAPPPSVEERKAPNKEKTAPATPPATKATSPKPVIATDNELTEITAAEKERSEIEDDELSEIMAEMDKESESSDPDENITD